MKHLFYVHSHITFLVSKQYVFDQGINPEDCLLLSSRKYILPEKYKDVFKHTLQFPQDVYHSDEVNFFKHGNIFNAYRKARVIENIVNDFTHNAPFIFYTLNTGSHVHSIIVTMDNCKGYYLIEEGANVYYPLPKSVAQLYKGWRNILFKLFLRPLMPKFFLLKDNVFSTSSEKYCGTIASLKMAFADFRGEHFVTSNPFENINLDFKPDVLISVDGSLCLYDISIKDIQQLFSTLMHKYIHDAVVAYKFHPIFLSHKSKMDEVKNILNEVLGESSQELSCDVVLENILYTYHCDFYSDWSSVGIYGKSMGCKCYSYFPLLLGISTYPEYEKEARHHAPILKQFFTFLS